LKVQEIGTLDPAISSMAIKLLLMSNFLDIFKEMTMKVVLWTRDKRWGRDKNTNLLKIGWKE
jgi:hypothetical protein